jgi:glycosyltransferase involved in cell wall biosynthesis
MLALARRFTDLRFLWVGGEPAAVSAWQSRLADEQVYNVRLTGFVENARLPLYQAACDVLLMPYERRIAVSGGGDTAEFANPMKAFEYLASGRPILASDLPVMREVLDPELALLLPPQDEAAWADALAAMLDDPARRRSMGEAARTAAQGYSWQARAEKALAGLGPIAA